MNKTEQIRRNAGLHNLYEIADDGGYCEPVGYVEEGDIYCKECFESDGSNAEQHEAVMFSSEEVDSPVLCGGCGILLPTSLTSDGVEYVKGIDGRTLVGKLYRKAFSWVWS